MNILSKNYFTDTHNPLQSIGSLVSESWAATFILSDLLHIVCLAFMAGGLNDHFTGSNGSDMFIGGGGAGDDIFVFDSAGTEGVTDVIRDFGEVSGNRDIIDLSAVFGDVNTSDFDIWKSGHVSQSGSNAIIDLGAGQIQLEGIQTSALTYDDFNFQAGLYNY